MKIIDKMDQNLKKTTRFFGRVKRKLSDKTPDILQAVGTIGVITGFGLCIKASFKAKEVLDEKGVNKESALEVAEIYTPPVAATGVGLYAFNRSHKIMKERYASRVAAFVSVANAFKKYRRNVVSLFGKETDDAIAHGGTVPAHDVNSVKSDGSKTLKVPSGLYSEYARYYTKDTIRARFKKDLSLNIYTIRSVQNVATDILKARGYIFLNDVYDMLGLSRTLAGQSVGWIYGGSGDNEVCIDYFIVNGNTIIVDFNVDGFIRDKRLVDSIEVLL